MRVAIAIAVSVAAGCSFDTSGLGSWPDPPDAGASSAKPDADHAVPDDSPDAMIPAEEPDAAACMPGEELCRDHGDLVCFDLATSDRNCGECGRRCGGSERCVEGSCEEDD